MALPIAFFLTLLLASVAPAVLGASSRPRLLGTSYGYPPKSPSPSPKSPSPSKPSPVTPSAPTPPYTTPTTPSSPSPVTPSTPSPVTPSPVTPSSPAPVSPSAPAPVTIPPVTSSPRGRYGGYGSRSGRGTSSFWRNNSGRVPRILSLLTTLAKVFGQAALKRFGNRMNLFGAIKDTSPEAMSSLAREGTASLINSYAYSDFPLDGAAVINQFNDALIMDTAAQQAMKFQELNEAM